MHSCVLTVVLIVSTLLVHGSFALKCYEGSKGLVNGEPSSNFVETTCEDGMTHCFSSYNGNHTDVTAACQTPATEHKLLDVCKEGCVEHADIDVTVCCCDTDLCNLSPSDKPPSDDHDQTDVIEEEKAEEEPKAALANQETEEAEPEEQRDLHPKTRVKLMRKIQ